MSNRANQPVHPVSIFLSHAQQDKDLAEKLAHWIEKTFPSMISVFVSSRWGSIEMGDDFFATILQALRNCAVGMVLATPNSLSRPWVNIEVGGLHLLNRKLIPVCIAPTTIANLPAPIDRKQACEYSDVESRLTLLRNIAKVRGLEDAFVSKYVTRAQATGAPKLGPVALQVPTKPPNSEVGHRTSIEGLFETDDRWTTIVYTCRATFRKDEDCPDSGRILISGKSLKSHVPVDEVQTVCAAINHLMPAEERANEDDILHTVVCSKIAEELVRRPHDASEQGPPHLLDRDLVVVGENNFSNLLLHKMKPYLPWERHFSWQVEVPDKPGRPRLSVQLAEHAQFAQPSRSVGQGGGMISIFPSPFNLRKRVIVLFGCHREGQFALEHWLRSEGVHAVISSIKSSVPSAAKVGTAVQVVVQSLGPIPRNGIIPRDWRTVAIPNSSDGQRPYWLVPLRSVGPSDALQVNQGCSNHQEMYDISVVAELAPEEKGRLEQIAMSRIAAPDLYWENRECDLGFHITLYEFCTEDKLDTEVMAKLEKTLGTLASAWARTSSGDVPPRVSVSVRGIETLPKAVISYVDFPSANTSGPNWLATLRCWCEQQADSIEQHQSQLAPILSRRRAPFPAHITLCRFNRPIESDLERRLRELSLESRYEELLTVDIRSISLVVGRRRPYRDTKVVRRIELTS